VASDWPAAGGLTGLISPSCPAGIITSFEEEEGYGMALIAIEKEVAAQLDEDLFLDAILDDCYALVSEIIGRHGPDVSLTFRRAKVPEILRRCVPAAAVAAFSRCEQSFYAFVDAGSDHTARDRAGRCIGTFAAAGGNMRIIRNAGFVGCGLDCCSGGRGRGSIRSVARLEMVTRGGRFRRPPGDRSGRNRRGARGAGLVLISRGWGAYPRRDVAGWLGTWGCL
jgi:hypothetical protein